MGLMSGTSLDGIDGVLAQQTTSATGLAGPWRVLGHMSTALPSALRAELLALNAPGPQELHRAASAAQALSHVYAEVVQSLLAHAGTLAHAVRAIGAHGQTVRHQPQQGYTIQLLNGALLAELTGIDVVCDFRSRDVAAGGQGAPLVPAFHQLQFGHSSDAVAVLNLGGIANLTFLVPGQAVLGFDCGPANTLMDAWCQRHTGEAFDRLGRWASTGHVLADLLASLMAEPFVHAPAPKSTGLELFNATWLNRHLAACPSTAAAQAAQASGVRPEAPTAWAADVQATLLEYTAQCVALHVQQSGLLFDRLVVCGGGAYNAHLMQRLGVLMPRVRVLRSDDVVLPAQQVEAVAFAWLAERCLERQPGNLVSVTGARGPRVLGAIYQGASRSGA
jgi:anhydro-N-acetylmuramic acid kinase